MGRERFHPLDPVSYFTKNVPKWVFEVSSNKAALSLKCFSDETISFHYVSPTHMKYLSSFKYFPSEISIDGFILNNQ